MKFIIPILIIGFLAFSPAFKAEILDWDDEIFMTERPLTINSVKEIFNSTPDDIYVPLTVLSFAIENALFGQNPLAYHFDNVLLHLTVVYFVFVLVTMLGFSSIVACLTALIFCVHPIHVESVAWIAERKDVLYSVFYLVSIVLYIKYWKENKSWLYIASIICAGLSILSKPMALSLPLIIILLDWYMLRMVTKKSILDKFPYFLIVIPIASVTFNLNHELLTTAHSNSLIVWVWSLVFYIQKLIFPLYLAHQYSYPSFSSWNNETILSLITFAAIIGGLWILRKRRLIFLSVCWVLFSLFFLLRLYPLSYDTVADRFVYLPSMGICLAIAVALAKIPHKAGVVIVSFLLISYLSFRTFEQTRTWTNTNTFAAQINKYNSKSFLAWYFLGREAFDQAKLQDAVYDLTKAIKLQDDPDAYFYRAKTYANLLEFDLALKDTLMALKYREKEEDSINRVVVLRERIYKVIQASINKDYENNKFDIALKNVQLLIERYPESGWWYHWRGAILDKLGEGDKAMEDFELAYQLYGDENKEQKKIIQENLLVGYQREIDKKVAVVSINKDGG